MGNNVITMFLLVIPVSISSDQHQLLYLIISLVNSLRTRFDETSSQLVVEFMQILPSEIIKNPTRLSPANCESLLDFYEDDLPLS